MTDVQDLTAAILALTAAESDGGDIAAKRDDIWSAAVILAADCLLTESDELTRRRWLRDLPEQIRESMGRLSELQRPPAPSSPFHRRPEGQ
jgi:hypothetical protein